MRKAFFFLALTLLLAPVLADAISAGDESVENEAVVYIFWNYSCPYCNKELAFMEEMKEKYPEVEFRSINVSENQEKFQKMCQEYDVQCGGWPRTFIGTKPFYGFTTEKGELSFNPVYRAYAGYANQLEKAIVEEFGIGNNEPLPDPEPVEETPLPWPAFVLIPLYLLTYPFLKKRIEKKHWIAGLMAIALTSAFLFVLMTPKTAIENFASGLPFPAFVFIIALIDGFNPCAFTVLAILLSLLTYTKSKKKMALIGGTFIITSGVMYFIFIMALLLIGSWFFSQYGLLVLRLVGASVLVAGAINIKDFFFFKKGVSLTISEKDKKTIYGKARAVVQNVEKAASKKALAFALAATVALAVFVNLVELGCSAILPAAYMGSLLQMYGHDIGTAHILFTAMYAAIYIIPLFAILFNFIYFFKSERVSESKGKILKLLGGVIMVLLGLLMLLNPELLVFA